MKKLLCVLVLALVLAACAPVGETPSPAPEPSGEPEEQVTLLCLCNGASALSAYMAPRLEDWAEEEGWEFISYDCQGLITTQNLQVGDLIRSGKTGVVVLFPLLSGDALDDAVRDLHQAGCQVITLGAAPSPHFTRYVRYRLTVDDDAALETAISVVNQGIGRRQASYLCLSNYWPEFREDTIQEGLRDSFQRVDVQYTGGNQVYGCDFTAASLEEHPDTDFVFAFSPAPALGAAQALSEAGLGARVPVYTVLGERNVVVGVSTNRLAGAVAVPPAESWALLQDAVRNTLAQSGSGEVALPLRPVTPDNIDAWLEEYDF